MRAVRWHGRFDVRLDEVPAPEIRRADDVLIRVLYCGVCGTDIEEYREGPLILPAGKPHPLTGRQAPLTLGHEFCGEVLAVGAAVTSCTAGDVVAVEGNRWCGRCWWCRRGEHNLCPDLAQYGLHDDGGLAEQAVVAASTCRRMPRDADPRLGALAEPLSVAVRAVRRSGLGAGASVGIIGAGPIGLLVAQVARARGAGTIAIVQHHRDRRELARLCGIDRVIDPAEGPVAFVLGALCDGIGPDVTFQCSGHPSSAGETIAATRRGGTAVLLSYPIPGTTFDTGLLLDEKTIVTSLTHDIAADFDEGLRLAVSGEVAAGAVVTDVFTLDETIARVFRAEMADVLGKALVSVGAS
jgi:(R,R)-butanediol dehydrogenase/meso-butanediol dehydrogenase/diacetyl reductase